MQYKILIDNNRLNETAGTLSVGLDAPIGDIPLFVRITIDKESNSCRIGFDYKSTEKKDITLESDNISIVYGKISGRIYNIIIRNFSVWSKTKRKINILRKIINQPIEDKRFKNVFDLGTKLALKSIEKNICPA